MSGSFVAPWVAEMPGLTVLPFRNNSQITVMLIVRTNNTLRKKWIPKDACKMEMA